jgi:hypothetical protein
LLVVTATPIDDKARTLEWLWNESRVTPLTLYSLNRAPYDDVLPLNFYRPPALSVLPLSGLGRMQNGAASRGRQVALYHGLGPLHLVPPAPVDCLPVMDDLLPWRAAVERRGLLPARPVQSICEARPIGPAAR